MVCESRRKAGQTAQERRAQVDAALRRLEAQLTAGKVGMVVGTNGAVALRGWQDRDDITDACAIRALLRQNSWPLRQALQRAEQAAGRKVSQAAVAGGVHSHDGGATWHHGH